MRFAAVSNIDSVLRGSAALAVLAALTATSPAFAAAPANSVVKVVNGNSSASADDGWVIYKGKTSAPTLRRYVLDASGSFTASGALKLKTAGLGSNNAGLILDVGGVVFASCPAASAPSRCAAGDLGTAGVGLGYGQLTFGGAGGQAGGWVSDATVTAQASNPDQTPGSIAAIAADATNGAYAVGWDQPAPSFTNHGEIITLNAAAKTFKIVSRTDLGTLGGQTSQALGINKNASLVVGVADDATGKGHAVTAPTTGTAWTDITGAFPAGVIQSQALVASNNGFVAGNATVKRTIGSALKSVKIGFRYNTNTEELVFFEAPGADVTPLAVLNDGRVVGNLVVQGVGAVKEQHPFMYDGTVHDYGKMTLSSTHQPAFGCRVNKPNTLGELVGTCIPDGNNAYGVTAGGFAFYIDTNQASPVFVDLNAALHTNANSTIPAIKTFTFSTATSIDDQHEVVMLASKVVSGNLNTGIYLASKQAYNP